MSAEIIVVEKKKNNRETLHMRIDAFKGQEGGSE